MLPPVPLVPRLSPAVPGYEAGLGRYLGNEVLRAGGGWNTLKNQIGELPGPHMTAGLKAPARNTPVDVELVFAVDSSDSMEDWEWRLEMAGIAAAFRSKPVQDVIGSLPHGRVAVALLIWADATKPADASPWRVIEGKASAETFAAEVEGWPRRVGGGTGMGAGIAAAVRLIEASPFEASRRVVDVSGDGPEPLPLLTEYIIMMPEARALAERAGVTVNGLAILKDMSQLYEWYQFYVPVGAGAFVMQIKTVKDFAPAFEMKLLRELQTEVAGLDRLPGPDLSPL